MSLPKKDSRTITVDGVVYRWAVVSAMGDSNTRVIVHLDLKDPGQVLHVDFNGEFIVTPDPIADMIRWFLAHSWDPQKEGKFWAGPDRGARFLKHYRALVKDQGKPSLVGSTNMG